MNKKGREVVMGNFDGFQLFDFVVATITGILSIYLIVVTAYWTVKLKKSHSTLRPFILGVTFAKASVLGALLIMTEINTYMPDWSLAMLPVFLGFLAATGIQTWVTMRIRPAPHVSAINLEKEIHVDGQMVLIVEDNEPLARIYRRVLERADMNAEFVLSGRDALVFIRQEMPCLMVVDIGLPDMDGVDLALEARRAGYLGPIVAISGAMDLIDEKKLEPAKFDQILSKPIRPGDLIGAVYRWARKP